MTGASNPTLGRVALVLGGARSGKSALAEQMTRELAGSSGTCLYIATAQALDAEMRARIAAHRARRGKDWRTLDVSLAIATTLAREAKPGRAVLVDCLTLWLSNLIHAEHDIDIATHELIESLLAARCPVVLVANEIGLGIVPDNALARAFRDHAGRLNQAIAAIAGRVVFVAAGLALTLKDTRA
jgi:adenosylcobinamide kinase/adenosylcobinamide-phosphate guanylyltransferase